MSVVKRSLALAMALVMLLMTLGAVTVQTVYGVTDEDVDELNSTYSADGNSLNVSFTVKDTTTQGVISNHVRPDNSTVTVDESASDFKKSTTADDIKVTSYVNVGVGSQAHYKVQANNIKPKTPGKGGKLQLTVTAEGPEPGKVKYTRTIKVDIEDKDNGGGTPAPSPTPPTSEDKAKYTVRKVSTTRRVGSGDKAFLVPNSERFNIDKVSNTSDATIRQTYVVDITVRINDVPHDLDTNGGDIVAPGASVDMGSFYYQQGRTGDDASSNSTIEVTSAGNKKYDVKFTNLYYSGNGNELNFTINKKNTDYSKDITAIITQCITKQEADKVPSRDDDDDDSKIDVETPYVIVNKYSYGGGSVTAGENFPLSLTIYNTSETEVIGNMMVTVTMPEGLMLTSSSNTFYVEELDKNASITKSMQVTAKVDAKPQSHTVDVSMKYQYVDDRANARRSAETTEKIAIPVVQVDRFQVTGVEIPMESMLGEEISITVNFVNKGRSEAYNLSAEIDGNIQNPGQNQNLGNLASGVTGTADFFIQPNEVGMCTGEIRITYEDTNMVEKTSSIRYNTTIKSPEEYMGGGMVVGPGGMGIPTDGEMPPEEEKKSNLPMIIIGVVIVAVPVLIVVKKKLDAKRKEREDADL